MSSAKALVRSGTRVSLHMWKHCTADDAISRYRRNTGCWISSSSDHVFGVLVPIFPVITTYVHLSGFCVHVWRCITLG